MDSTNNYSSQRDQRVFNALLASRKGTPHHKELDLYGIRDGHHTSQGFQTDLNEIRTSISRDEDGRPNESRKISRKV